MKATELRISNLVDLGNRIAKVIEINHLACVVVDLEETQDTIEDYDRIKPIPLTEELLLKFGFEKQMAWTYKISLIGNKNLVYYLGEKGWSIGNKNYSDFSCEHVHQLQNLYFALTSEELTFKSESDERRN